MQTSYSVAQLLWVTNVAVSMIIPCALALDYLKAVHMDCYGDIEDYYKVYKELKMFSVFICVETILTRAWVLLETQKLLALMDGRPLHEWATRDRMMWVSMAVLVALGTDGITAVWALRAGAVCDVQQLTESQLASLSALCRHSIKLDGPAAAVYHLCSMWHRIVRRGVELVDAEHRTVGGAE